MTVPVVGAIALPRWQQNAIYVCVAGVAVTGIAWLLLSRESLADSADARAAATWLLRAHGITAYALLLAVGSALPVHLRLGWTRQRNRWSGGALVALLAVLAGTGLWLYYGPPAGRDAISLGHWVVGVALPVWLVLHRAWGLRSRRQPSP